MTYLCFFFFVKKTILHALKNSLNVTLHPCLI